jgi:hypothetical protein
MTLPGPDHSSPGALGLRWDDAARTWRAGAAYAGRRVGSLVPRLTAKAFAKYGFSIAGLVTDWPAIVGSGLAACTAPERLKWPPRRSAEITEDDTAEAGSVRQGRRDGATLVLRVDGARALDVQYNARQIIERINAFFGYAAVAELRIVQAPVGRAARQSGYARPATTSAAPLVSEVAAVPDAGLRSALARLGAEIRQRETTAIGSLAAR